MTEEAKDKKKPDSEKEERREELAVFKPNRPFSWGGRQVDLENLGTKEPVYLRLSHAQVELEIGLGRHKVDPMARRKKPPKPNSAVLNHCTLISASDETKKALKRFGA